MSVSYVWARKPCAEESRRAAANKAANSLAV
jgi:hypothetical protein